MDEEQGYLVKIEIRKPIIYIIKGTNKEMAMELGKEMAYREIPSDAETFITITNVKAYAPGEWTD